jgi:acyl carrier protein
MDNNDEKLSCPFCGGEDIRFDNHGRLDKYRSEDVWSTCCYNCGATFPNSYNRAILVKQWKRRPETKTQMSTTPRTTALTEKFAGDPACHLYRDELEGLCGELEAELAITRETLGKLRDVVPVVESPSEIPPSVSDRIVDIVEDYAVMDVTPESTFAELGIDSLDQVQLIMEVEDTFNVSVEDDEVGGLNSVGDLVELVNTKI